jgi:hypothetical protein
MTEVRQPEHDPRDEDRDHGTVAALDAALQVAAKRGLLDEPRDQGAHDHPGEHGRQRVLRGIEVLLLRE